MTSDEQEWEQVWRNMPDDQLDAALRDYEWLVKEIPGTFEGRLALVKAEWKRRRPDQPE